MTIDERIAYLDVDITGFRLRIITAYFRHSGYSDPHIQLMYHILTDLLASSRQKQRHTILTGDFNAQVGSRTATDNSRTIGLEI